MKLVTANPLIKDFSPTVYFVVCNLCEVFPFFSGVFNKLTFDISGTLANRQSLYCLKGAS